MFPISQARAAVARLKEGFLSLIPDCGHMPHVECPDLFLEVLDEFLGTRAPPIGGDLKKPEGTLGKPDGASERSPSDTDASSRSARQSKKHKE